MCSSDLNMDIMHAMKDALMKYETIDAGQIDDLMDRKTEIRAPKGWGDENDTMKASDDAPEQKDEQQEAPAEPKAETQPEQAPEAQPLQKKEDDKPQA